VTVSAVRSRRASGFTLIEILVVISILAALIGLLVPTISAVRRRSQAKTCKTLIDSISGAIAQYASDFGDFPPTSLQELGLRSNGVNEGAEALVRCLSTGDREGPYFDFKEEQLGNTDGDRLGPGPDPTHSKYPTRELLEVLDPWGNPLVYFHYRDYRGGRRGARVRIGDEDQSCRPQPSGKTGQYPGVDRFVIWSAGPDGVNEDGAGDDVTSW